MSSIEQGLTGPFMLAIAQNRRTRWVSQVPASRGAWNPRGRTGNSGHDRLASEPGVTRGASVSHSREGGPCRESQGRGSALVSRRDWSAEWRPKHAHRWRLRGPISVVIKEASPHQRPRRNQPGPTGTTWANFRRVLSGNSSCGAF